MEKKNRKKIFEDSESYWGGKRRISNAHFDKMKQSQFGEQEAKLYKKYKARRSLGLVVDTEWLKTQMKILVKTDCPSSDFKASCKWLQGFNKRKGISSQKETNKKSRSVEERIPLVKNFHWYTIYQMAGEKP